MTKKIIFFGTPQFAVPTLQRLLDSDRLQVVGVVTQPDKRRGRGNQLIPSPVKVVAMEQGLPVFQPQRIKKEPEVLDQLRSLHADYFVVVAYGQILSQEILDMPRLGCINVHGSILPEYRGAAPIQWCLYHGKTETGITTMLMDAGMDTGAMLLKATVPIGLLDDAHSLGTQLAEVGAELLVETIQQWLTVGIIPTPQNHDQATYAPLIRKTDYGLDWSRSAWDLHNQVRGFTPDCSAQFRDQPLKILATAPLGAAYWSALPPELTAIAQQWPQITEQVSPSTAPGQIVHVVKAIGPIVQTGEGLLLLRSVQLPGKRVQSGWDFANGLRLQPGEQLGNG